LVKKICIGIFCITFAFLFAACGAAGKEIGFTVGFESMGYQSTGFGLAVEDYNDWGMGLGCVDTFEEWKSVRDKIDEYHKEYPWERLPDADEKYNEEYFAENAVIIFDCVRTGGSHPEIEIKGVSRKGNKLSVTFIDNNPVSGGVVTAVMSYGTIIIEVKKADIKDINSFELIQKTKE
jgi:hypothetical protein